MTKRKKIIVLSCMIALLVATAVLNFVLSSSVIGGVNEPAVTTANYFTEIKTTKNTSRSKQLTQLNEVIALGSENNEAYSDALNMKVKLTAITEQENLLETLIKAKGYDEVAVTLGVSSDNLSVVVRDADFSQDDAVLIYSLCQKELNISPENVYIQSIS